MKKILTLMILTLCIIAAAFAQNVKSYTVDLSKFSATNGDKTAAFDKKTGTISLTGENAGIGLGLGKLDISNYNIARIKYKAIDGYGFFLGLNYDDNTLNWGDIATYCPSYLNEMVIPLCPEQKTINGLYFTSAWNVPSEKFVVEEITLEKVSNPEKTDLYASKEPPVLDKATSGIINEKISAWDYVKKLGVGFQYYIFSSHDVSAPFDFGTDVYTGALFSKPRKELIQFIRNKGFKTLRLQTSPEFFSLDDKYTISPQYMKELKQVVDWAIEEDMYVIIGCPWSEWLEKDEAFRKKVEEDARYAGVTISEKYKEKSKALIKAVWTQYAAAFNNSYDEHLIFEALNEPLDAFHEHGWSPKQDCSVCKKDFAILNEYNQLIVDTIRASGGNNAKRFIMVEGLGASGWQFITINLFKLPKDKTKDRLIPVVHLYPTGGRSLYTKGIKKHISDCFAALDKKYFSKHIPVYFSEIGIDTGSPIMERINCLKDLMVEVTNEMRSCNVNMMAAPHNKEGWGYYNEWTFEWYDSEFIDTLLYAAQGKEYPLSDDFIKANEIKIESIVGKNILDEPFNPNNWANFYKINPEILVRSVPEKYKLEFQIEKTGSAPILQFTFDDKNWTFNDLAARPEVKVTGAVKGNNFEVKSETVTLTINEKLSVELEDAARIYINGQDIIIKSVRVVE